MTQQTALHLARTVFGLTTLGLVGNILLAAVNTTPDRTRCRAVRRSRPAPSI